MKRIILVVLLLAFFAANYGVAEEEGYFILCRPESVVNLRNKPSKSAMVVGWLTFGDYVKTDGKTKNGFVHVIDIPAEDPEGWVYAGFLVWDKPRAETYKAQVYGGRVVARSCVDGKRLCVLREGCTVTVYARCNRWAVTNKGFVMCDWLIEVD